MPTNRPVHAATDQSYMPPRVRSLADARRLSMADIMTLHRESTRGNPTALATLQEASRILAHESNLRLNRLASHNMTQYAYQFALSFTRPAFNSDRYSESLTDPNALYKQILSARKFVSYKTSRVQGQRDAWDARIESFRQSFGVTPQEMSNRQVQSFLKLLGESPIRKLLSEMHHAGSEEFVELIYRKYSATPTARKEIIALMQQYLLTRDDGSAVKPNEKFYYDELQKYLRGEELPNLKIKRGRVYRLDDL